MTDTGTCPECGHTFTVTRYGHQIPCPHCNEALDIRPDRSTGNHTKAPPVDWTQAFKSEIAYLVGLRDEVSGMVTAEHIAGAAELVGHLCDRIVALTRKVDGDEM